MNLRNLVTCLLWIAGASAGAPAASGPVAWWRFDEGKGSVASDAIARQPDAIHTPRWIAGVSGSALFFDGITTSVKRPAASAPRVTNAITIEAWVAIRSYPWNWVGIVSRKFDRDIGYYFGIDGDGHLGIQLSGGGLGKRAWHTLKTKEALPIHRWVHVAGSYDEATGLALYVNGVEAARVPAFGPLTLRNEAVDLVIGSNQEKIVPTGGIRPRSHLAAYYSLDGALDELKIYDRALSAEELRASYAAVHAPPDPALPKLALPATPAGPAKFGAVYTKLQYDEAWDALWRVGPVADIVVRFDDSPVRLMFWRGTSYIPHWVTENGIWYNNEFTETWGHGVEGCAEPMSDKQTRYSNVRVIENSDARVVIHWRYALADVNHTQARVDEVSGWGDWADEYYTIYPDEVAVRKVVLWSSEPGGSHEFQETIIVNPPGTRPEDNIDTRAITLANLKGESHTYSWLPKAPAKLDQPENPRIQIVNLKSKAKPFLVIAQPPSYMEAYTGEITDASIFPWWNHWPVSQIPSDGRWTRYADRPSHTSLTHFEPEEYAHTENSMTKIMLTGMSANGVDALVPLARSWVSPPPATVTGRGFANADYDPSQRAFVIGRNGSEGSGDVECKLQADAARPLANPAFVIRNWGDDGVSLRVNGEPVHKGKDFRVGHVSGADGTDLVVFLRKQSSQPVTLSFSPVREQ